MKALMTILHSFTALPTSSFSDMVNLNRWSLRISSSTLRGIVNVRPRPRFLFDSPYHTWQIIRQRNPYTGVLLINLLLGFQIQTIPKNKSMFTPRACS